MSDYVIVTDSSCDLTEDLRRRFNIEDYIPGYIVFPDGHSEPSDLDWKQVSAYDFYSSMSKNCIYKTAQRSLKTITEFFEKYLAMGKDVLSITLSSGLSGTYSTCEVAAKELSEKYPERKIIAVDSLRYSGGMGMLCARAGEMKGEGKDIEEVAQWVRDNRSCVHQMGTVDDLMFLRKMGRVSNMSAIMGTLIGVKPLADMNEAGVNTVIGKTTGYKNTYHAIIEYMKKTIGDPHQRIFISYTNRKAQAMQLKEMIEQEFKPSEIIMTVVSKSCGAAIGPGMVAAFYIGKPITEGLKDETAYLAEILG